MNNSIFNKNTYDYLIKNYKPVKVYSSEEELNELINNLMYSDDFYYEFSYLYLDSAVDVAFRKDIFGFIYMISEILNAYKDHSIFNQSQYKFKLENYGAIKKIEYIDKKFNLIEYITNIFAEIWFENSLFSINDFFNSRKEWVEKNSYFGEKQLLKEYLVKLQGMFDEIFLHWTKGKCNKENCNICSNDEELKAIKYEIYDLFIEQND